VVDHQKIVFTDEKGGDSIDKRTGMERIQSAVVYPISTVTV
jgi:hypothetical protein